MEKRDSLDQKAVWKTTGSLFLFLLVGLQATLVKIGVAAPSPGRLIEAFPAVDQRALTGAEFRCGSIALGSWLIWLSENDGLARPSLSGTETSPIFDQPGLTKQERAILTEVDALAGGRDEIALLRLIETLIQYVHRNARDAKLEVHYYNLPNELHFSRLCAFGCGDSAKASHSRQTTLRPARRNDPDRRSAGLPNC